MHGLEIDSIHVVVFHSAPPRTTSIPPQWLRKSSIHLKRPLNHWAHIHAQSRVADEASAKFMDNHELELNARNRKDETTNEPVPCKFCAQNRRTILLMSEPEKVDIQIDVRMSCKWRENVAHSFCNTASSIHRQQKKKSGVRKLREKNRGAFYSLASFAWILTQS